MVKLSAAIDRTRAFLGERWRTLLPLALGAIWLPSALAALIAPLSAGAGSVVAIGVTMAGLVLTLIAYWGRTVVMTAAMAPEQGMAARLLATRRFAPLVGVMVVLGLVVLIVASPMAAILWTYGVQPDLGGGVTAIPAAALVPILLYGAALAPFLLLIGVRLILVPPVVVAEGLGIAAIGRSVALTRGMTGRIMGAALAYLIVVFVLTLAVTSGLGSVLILMLGGGGPWAAGVLVTLAVLAALDTVLGIAVSAFVGKLYLMAAARSQAAERETA
ncbi:hypothetical protein ACPVPU_05850 [Sphingomonas sp. CJ99]